MTEALVEIGIGETRGAIVEQGEIVEAWIEREGLRAGAIVQAKLATRLANGRRGIAQAADGTELLLEPLPAATPVGATLLVEIVREPIPEEGRPRLAKAVAAAPGETVRDGPSLADRFAGMGLSPVVLSPAGPDRLEAAGWSELIEEATSGDIAFPGGRLRLSLTPAMTLFDVDGELPPFELARAGARAAGLAIRRLGIGGSIGIDLPTLANRAERLAAAEALDAALPQPFERTAVNGFGFLQVVRRRTRASLPELLRADPVLAATLGLLRRAGREPPGAATLVAHPLIVGLLAERTDWLESLGASRGGAAGLRADAAMAISGGHVETRR